MTTEEFAGLLMGVLAGPKGPEVAATVLAVALTDPGTQTAVANQLAGMLDAAVGELETDVLNLQLIAQADSVAKSPPAGANPVRWAIDVAGAKAVMMKSLRERLRAKVGSSASARKLAARIGLDLGEESGT